MSGYFSLLSNRRFLAFWSGFTISATGDAMTRVALVWYVLGKTGSSEALGLLTFCSTAPVILGGLVAGWVLDRFDRRTVLIADSTFRALVVMSVPVADAVGLLTLPHVYAVALVHGFLMMIPLAGVPAILPSLVPAERLGAANALEILGYTISAMMGAPIAGLLIGRIGAPGVLWLDGASYVTFAVLLTTVRLALHDAPAAAATSSGGYRPALALLVSQPILLATTLMYLVLNIGSGALLVWLPLWAASVGGGADLYGRLLGVFALGQLASATAAGFLPATAPQGRLICLALAAAGLAVAPFASAAPLPVLFACMATYGAAYAPLTILGQTLRMRLIPPELRGRSFALLRMLMQSGNPVGGMAAGLLVPLTGLPATILATSLLALGPAVAGALVTPFRRARASAL